MPKNTSLKGRRSTTRTTANSRQYTSLPSSRNSTTSIPITSTSVPTLTAKSPKATNKPTIVTFSPIFSDKRSTASSPYTDNTKASTHKTKNNFSVGTDKSNIATDNFNTSDPNYNTATGIVKATLIVNPSKNTDVTAVPNASTIANTTYFANLGNITDITTALNVTQNAHGSENNSMTTKRTYPIITITVTKKEDQFPNPPDTVTKDKRVVHVKNGTITQTNTISRTTADMVTHQINTETIPDASLHTSTESPELTILPTTTSITTTSNDQIRK